ncbi:PspC domain-containing protein [Parasphingopyxis marina]|uniref:PspC domain-containing protein n=1 Tax=Parasphingopyxis marina TaxID=2761622 RepID=A0A842HXY9_9SPHN|nr:PspC domain-containing protein [Parasphingopyxis marina]MBC2776364.1 PspC domain-containing protein [Parasphingopyxis marina]
MTERFAIDRSNAKLMGVCAGFANWTGWNVLAVRLGLTALTLFLLGPVAILAYVLVGWVAQP